MAVHGSWLSMVAILALIAIHPYQHASASGRGPSGSQVATTISPCSAVTTVVHGYKCQNYDVTTDDGYILGVQRLPEGRTGDDGRKRQPVLLQHGLLLDGMTWLINSPDQSLALILADHGYDVWIANTRGTRFSRRHVSLDPSKPEFWDWTWDDLAMHDLPAVINLVFKQTGQEVHYVGHSLGTLIALASFSEGKLVDKLKSAALLSPIAYLSHMTTVLGVVAARTFIGEMTKLFGVAEFNPVGEPVANLLKALCDIPGANCYDLLSALTGKNCCLNTSTLDVLLKNEPQSTSTKNMVHLAQIVRKGKLAKYDYRIPKINSEHYGEAKLPVYNLTNIPRNFPMFLSYGGQDALSDVKDVENLLDNLKLHDVDKLEVQYVKDFAHMDFIIGVTAKDIVYNQIIAFFKNQP